MSAKGDPVAPHRASHPARAYEALMDAAWPAPERHDLGEWVLRAADGVTQRANSVWPRDPAPRPQEALL